MQFEKSRILELAGIPDSDEDKSVLAESRRMPASKRKVNKSSSPDTLVETQLRAAIRKEIASILEDIKENGDKDSKWMHRSIGKPQNSQTGRVTRGFLGLGFK